VSASDDEVQKAGNQRVSGKLSSRRNPLIVLVVLAGPAGLT
jgi:hypothetical protein